MTIAPLTIDHWAQVKAIYESGIAIGNATFQTTSPGWQEWDDSHIKTSRIVLIDGDAVLGWAALTPVSGRCVYAGVAEISVYVLPLVQGKGFGKQLLEALISQSEQNNTWTLQADIFPENKASLKIHQDTGFRIIGTREKIGKMNNIWRDTILLERRSKIIGVN
ncbi:MAG: N-acetyltransferase family protein [Sediminibacterium sp.]